MVEEYVPYYAPSYPQGPVGYHPSGGPVQRLPYRPLKSVEPREGGLLQSRDPRDCDSDRGPRRDSDRSRGSPNQSVETYIIEPGTFPISRANLEGSAPINILSSASWTQPDVIVTGKITTGGNKSWEGVRFQRGQYEVNSRSTTSERFVNCVFEEGWTLIFDGSVQVTFIGCRWEIEGTERRLRSNWDRDSDFDRERDRERNFRSAVVFLGASTGTFENCEVNVNDGSTLDSWASIGSTADSQASGQILFQGLRARLSPMGRTETNTRQFTLVEIETSVPILFTGGSVLINGRLAEIDIFSSSQNCNTVTLTVTDSTFTNTNLSEIYVALIKNLWAVQPSRAVSPSIKVIRVTLTNVRILYYRAPTAGSVCAEWQQNILLSDVTSTFTTATIATVVSPIDVEGFTTSTWTIIINNVNISTNFANAPLRFSRLGSLNLLLGSGIFYNYTSGITGTAADTASPGAPPWLVLENIDGTVTIIASPALSIVGFSSPGTLNIPDLVTNAGVAPIPF